MRKLLVLIFMFVGIVANTQTLRQFEGTASIYFSSGSGPTYSIRAFYNDQLSYYSSDSAQVGDILYVLNGGACARLRVSVVRSKTGGILDIDVFDIDGAMLAPPSGVGGITRETNIKGLPMYMIGISQSLRTCVGSHLAIKSDTLDTSLAIIDSTVIRNDSIFLAVTPDEFYVGPASSGSVGVDSIQYVRDTTLLSPQTGDQFVNSSKDTSGVYASDRWLLSIGGSGSVAAAQVGAISPIGIVTPTGKGVTYIDTILKNSYIATGITNVDWEKIRERYTVDSINQILNNVYPTNALITVKGSGYGEFSYLVSDNSVSGFTTDTVMVVPTLNSKFAVIQPESGDISVGWFTNGTDLLDDTQIFRTIGSFLRYSNASTLFVPKGDWYINENLSNYNPAVNIYGNLVGASRDSSIIRVDSITGLETSINVVLFLVGDNVYSSGLSYEVIGDPLYAVDSRHLSVLGIDGFRTTVENSHFRKMTMGSSNTAGNTYIAQSTTQSDFAYSTTTIDTIYPGSSVGIKVADSEGLTGLQAVVLADGSGHFDTTYVTFNYTHIDSIVVNEIKDTLYSGATVQVPGYGVSETKILNNIFENIWDGTGIRIISQNAWIERNKFINNGQIGNQHDMYNQCGMQVIRGNWFEGGYGYAFNDANKQNYRLSGARIIEGNTFFNKPLCIAYRTSSNPVSWYATAVPVSYYGNKILAEGDKISNNLFFNTPGKPASTAFAAQASFGGVDPNSPLLGNGSVSYVNNTHIGRWTFSGDNQHLNLKFSDNEFYLNDTSNVSNSLVTFPDSAKLNDNIFISRGPDHFELRGNKLKIDNLTFHQHEITTINEQNLAFSNSHVTNSIITLDSARGLAQTQAPQFTVFDGGKWEGNTFSYLESSIAYGIGIVKATDSDMPDMIRNTFVGSGIVLESGFSHDENIKNTIVKDNQGMRLWSDGLFVYEFGGIEQTEASGSLVFNETHTLNADPQTGSLITVGTDSTYVLSTHLSTQIDGVLVMGGRFDSIIAYTSLYEGQILRINTTNATTNGDYLVVDTLNAGKLKSQGLTPPLGTNLLAIAQEDVTVWDSGTTYAVGDIVVQHNKNFRCSYPHINQEPPANGWDSYWNSAPLKVQIIHSGFIDQARISGITNPLGGTNTIQASLDSLNATKDYAYMSFSDKGLSFTPTGAGTYDRVTSVDTLYSGELYAGDLTAQGDTIIVGRNGMLKVEVSLSFLLPSSGSARVKVLKNGTEIQGGAQLDVPVTAGHVQNVSFTALVSVAENDVISVGIEGLSGNPTLAAGTVYCRFE